MKFNIPYTNHGINISHIEDIIMLIKYSLESVKGNTVNISPYLDFNACNIIFEYFPDKKMLECLLSNKIDYIIIATEFVGDGTFNDFHNSGYGRKSIWKRRYDNFIKASERARSIWVFYPNLVKDYEKIVGEKVVFFPMTYNSKFKQFERRNFNDMDFDIIFSGTITRYRKKILTDLMNCNFRVVGLPAETLTFIRNDFYSRAKIGLNIRQSASWKYPSLMRYHYHLSNGIPIISERCEHDSYLDKYVIITDESNLIQTCLELKDKRKQEDLSLHLRFIDEMRSEIFIPEVLNKTFSSSSSKSYLSFTELENANFVELNLDWYIISHKKEEKFLFDSIAEKYTLLEWFYISIRKLIRKILQFFKLKKYCEPSNVNVIFINNNKELTSDHSCKTK